MNFLTQLLQFIMPITQFKIIGNVFTNLIFLVAITHLWVTKFPPPSVIRPPSSRRDSRRATTLNSTTPRLSTALRTPPTTTTTTRPTYRARAPMCRPTLGSGTSSSTPATRAPRETWPTSWSRRRPPRSTTATTARSRSAWTTRTRTAATRWAPCSSRRDSGPWTPTTRSPRHLCRHLWALTATTITCTVTRRHTLTKRTNTIITRFVDYGVILCSLTFRFYLYCGGETNRSELKFSIFLAVDMILSNIA